MIPMTSRDQACMKLATIVEGVVSMNDTSAWKRLFTSVLVASGCLLCVAITGPRLPWSTVSWEQRRISEPLSIPLKGVRGN